MKRNTLFVWMYLHTCIKTAANGKCNLILVQHHSYIGETKRATTEKGWANGTGKPLPCLPNAKQCCHAYTHARTPSPPPPPHHTEQQQLNKQKTNRQTKQENNTTTTTTTNNNNNNNDNNNNWGCWRINSDSDCATWLTMSVPLSIFGPRHFVTNTGTTAWPRQLKPTESQQHGQSQPGYACLCAICML